MFRKGYKTVRSLLVLAKEFETAAIDLLNICFTKNANLTEQLLIRQLPHWGKNSCIELAIASRSRNFIAHQAKVKKLHLKIDQIY